MKRIKRLVLLLAMTLGMVFLTGCYGANIGMNMNADGSGKLSFGLMVENSVYKLLGSEAEELNALTGLGFVKGTTTYNGETYVTFTKSASFATPSELQKLLTDEKTFGKKFFGTTSSDYAVALLGSAEITKNSFQGVYNGSLTRDDIEEGLDSLTESIFTTVGITFTNDINFSNGTVSEDKKSVSWTFNESLNDRLLQASTVGDVFSKDTTKPVVTGVKNNQYYNELVYFSLSDNVGIKSATINGKKMGNEDYVYNAAKYTVVAKDFAGNTTTVTFYIDYKAPTVSGVKNGSFYKTSKKITFTDNRAIKSATLNGKTVKSGKVVSNPGKYTLKVTDKAGNVKKVTFVIDKKKPVVTGVTNGKTYKTSKTIKFSDNRAVKTATLNGKKIKSGKVASASGNYTLKVTDKAGNVKTVKFKIKK